ncbi:MAG: peptide ABC transporter, ATP-binding protein [Osedax symbiont Rs2]|nr:MAG: peptide ABC transporter, ATP-binding protein [Osedax symbiont Rs2]
MSEAFISVRNLSKGFTTSKGVVQAVRDVSFDIPRGSITGLVGESGSGKTTLGRAMLRLIEPSAGSISFDGIDLLSLDERQMRKMRKRMQIIFQDPYSSLNPRMRVLEILSEALIAHDIGANSTERKSICISLLQEVGLSAEHINRYPHEFSGGQRQRIGIARALAVEPDFLVADESVSALDVSVQAQILNLLRDLCTKRNLTMLFIAHDLSVVEYLCDQIIVLYLGRPVEIGSAEQVYQRSAHPYTQALLSAAPIPDPSKRRARVVLKGDIPSPYNPPSGCAFRNRCQHAIADCSIELPTAVEIANQHFSFCKRTESII